MMAINGNKQFFNYKSVFKVCQLSHTCNSPDTKVQKSEFIRDGRDMACRQVTKL